MSASFTGTSITVTINDQGTNFFTVVIDNDTQTLSTQSGTNNYTLAQNLPAGTHTLWIEKITESYLGSIQFLGLTTDPGASLVSTPAPFSRRIEMIGDSITCGYGDEGQGPNCPFTADTENEYLAYGAIAARALDAEHFSISYSGIGMYRDYSGNTGNTMSLKYGRIYADDPNSVWDFSWTPDIVVINLGTNDFATGDPGQPFVTAYNSFVQMVRGHYPNAFILLVVGPMIGEPDHTTAVNYVQGVVNTQAAAGDTQMGFLDLGIQDANNGLGCDYHPSLATQQIMATALEGAIRQAMGW